MSGKKLTLFPSLKKRLAHNVRHALTIGSAVTVLSVFLMSCVSMQDRMMTSQDMAQATIAGKVTSTITVFQLFHIPNEKQIKTRAYSELMRIARQKYQGNIAIRNITITGKLSGLQWAIVGGSVLAEYYLFYSLGTGSIESYIGAYGALLGINLIGNFQKLTVTGDVISTDSVPNRNTAPVQIGNAQVPNSAQAPDSNNETTDSGTETMSQTQTIPAQASTPPQPSVTWNVNNTNTWIEAVNGVRSGGNNKSHTITVTGNISVPASNESTFGTVTGITVTIEGSGALSPSANGNLLYVGNEQMIIAKDLTLQGRTNNNASVVIINGGGTFRMEGNAKVTGNTGNGVTLNRYNGNSGMFIMDGGTISGNTGNGVSTDSGTFTMNGGTISGNTGRGVYINSGGTFTMDGGSISSNTGCGVYLVAHGYTTTFTLRGGTISGNNVNGGDYGGVCINGGTFTMQGGTISNNTANNGGGVYNSGKFTMQGGTISNNTANLGGGVSTDSGTFTMQGGTISNNTAIDGGGVYINGYSNTFTMQGNASVSGNTATNSGGGVCLAGTDYYTFTMRDNASMSGNTAGQHGGGVAIISIKGTFAIGGSASLSGNTATYYGGGVYNSGTFIKTGGTIYGDDADQNLKNTVINRIGHVVYETHNGSWRNATAGPAMNTDSYGFWLNDGVIFPSGFTGTWRRSNFYNTLTLTEDTIKSSSSNNLWVLQNISGNAYTFKRSDATNTITLTIRLDSDLVISGDSGSDQDNWNGTWRRQ